MAPFLVLEARTERPRAEATSSVVVVLGEQGAFVTGTEQLGGLALMLRLELPVRAAATLDARLAAVGIRLDASSREALVREVAAAQARAQAAGAEEDDGFVGSLLLRFFAKEPDAKIEIPKVPG